MTDSRIRNRAFDEMRKPALQRLEGKEPGMIAKNTGIPYDREKNVFSLKSLGKKIEIQYPCYEIRPELNEWHHLLLLHYLDMADGAEPEGEPMAFGDLPGGMARGGGFDRQSERTLSRELGNGNPAQVRKACGMLGGEIKPSNADLCAVFSVFPFYPLTLKLWFADEDIPGSGRMFLDKSAAHFLSVEDAVTAGTLLLEELIKEYRKLCHEGYTKRKD